MVSNRTYERVGTKIVLAKVVDSSATTHSYSIQLNVNKNGELGKILYICLQEITGNEFGPNIKLEVIIFYNKSIIIIKKNNALLFRSKNVCANFQIFMLNVAHPVN